MKNFRIFAFFLGLVATALVLSPARARADVSFDFFYDNLSPYGQWVDVEGYGACWQPGQVDVNWNPYTDGYWAYTDAGWTWISYENFGGIVYHYGRWVRVDGAGWCWVPDYEWAPAWVSWRSSADYVGWAPLPPEARWRHDVGFSVWVDSAYDIGPGYYSFCHTRDFGAPVLRAVIIEPGQNVAIIRGTVNITNITYNTGFAGGAVVFNGGPNFAVISGAVAHPIPTLKLVTNVNVDPASWHNQKGSKGFSPIAAHTVGNQLIVMAPHVSAPADPAAFRAKAKVVYTADRVSKGWGLVKTPEAQQALRQEIRHQAKGLTPESAPAHAVAATDLKFVPSAGDAHAKTSLVTPNEPREKPVKERHDPIVAAPNNAPVGNPALKPFTAEPSGKPGSSIPPATKGSAFVEPPTREPGRPRVEDDRKAQEKPIATQQEEDRRRAFESKQPRSSEVLKGQEVEKDHKTETFVPPPRANQFPPPVQRGAVVPGSPLPGKSSHSKDSKDKDKDRNGN